ncbi:Endolysin [Acetobacteraceae bacterium EV16G]
MTTIAFRLIAHFESCNLTPQQCLSGAWTIGYGSTCLPDGAPVQEDSPAITQVQADILLTRMIIDIEQKIEVMTRVSLSPAQYAALTSFIYNVGDNAFSGSTLLRKLNEGDYQGAADQFLLWIHAGGVTLRELTRRREAERQLFLHGEDLIDVLEPAPRDA